MRHAPARPEQTQSPTEINRDALRAAVKLRCQIGDLAVFTGRCNEQVLGKFCRVIAVADLAGQDWYVEILGEPVPAIHKPTGAGRYSAVGMVPDHILTPIRDEICESTEQVSEVCHA